MTIILCRVLYSGEKHAKKKHKPQRRECTSKLDFGHAGNRPRQFFFSFLFTYLQPSLQKFHLSMQLNLEIQLYVPECYYYPLNHARTDKKSIFPNRFNENIYKVIHEQMKQTKQYVFFSSLLELGKLTLG